MNELEDRIRRGLDVEPAASAEAMLSAVAGRVQLRRQRRTVALAVGVTAAVTAAVVVLNLPGHGPEQPLPPTETPTETPKERSSSQAPSAADDPAGLHSVDGALVLVTYDPAERGRAITLWQQADGRWERLSTLEDAEHIGDFEDGRALDLTFFPNGRDVVATGIAGDRVAFSRDGARSWDYVDLPWNCDYDGDFCPVRVYGDYVFAGRNLSAPEGGATWSESMRIEFGGTRWERVPLPRLSDAASWYGFPQQLDNGTLIVDEWHNVTSGSSTSNIGAGHYRVSTDDGSTWSERRAFPAEYSYIDGVYGNTVVSWCYTSAGSCGSHLSTDLVNWEPVTESPGGEEPLCPAVGYHGEDTVQVGGRIYSIFHLNFRDGRELKPRMGIAQQGPHRVSHVLMVSRDGCRTWRPVLE